MDLNTDLDIGDELTWPAAPKYLRPIESTLTSTFTDHAYLTTTAL